MSGLDWRAARVALPTGLDREFVRTLLLAAESAYVRAWWEYFDSQNPRKKD